MSQEAATTSNQPSKDDDDKAEAKQVAMTSKDYYFDSYAHFGIHEEMLKDTVRTTSYRNSIIHNRHIFEGKVVLDVGCGTGILSMFAAKAGAKKVFAVDYSSIAGEARKIVKNNGLDDVVEVIQGKIEDLTLPVEKVDIIISEWMGYFLLYESMLDTVLYARDKWLDKENGKIFPDKGSMYICGIEDAEYKDQKVNFWDNVYGFDMSSMKRLVMMEPLVETVEARAICTTTDRLIEFDMVKMKNEEVDFNSDFMIMFEKNDYLHALVVYFDVDFTECHKPVTFSTGPESNYTHWKQTIFYLPDEIIGCQGEELKGTISCKRNENNKRDLDIQISYQFDGARCKAKNSAFYRLR